MWWINKNGTVEGPFTSDQIEKRVKLNMLRSLDRVSNDKVKWLYLRDTKFWNPTRTLEQSISPALSTTPRGRLHADMPFEQTPRFTSSTPFQTRFPQDTPSARGKSAKGRLPIAIVAMIAVLLGCGALVWFMIKGFTFASSDPLSSVYQAKQQAVGLVTLTFQGKDGSWVTIPIGTAFAIGKSKFVTNAHVAYALKNGFEEFKNNLVEYLLKKFLCEEAMKQGKPYDRYLRDIGESDIEQVRSGLLERWKERGVKIRDIEIRLNHSNGKSFRVAKVQVHPRYDPAEGSGEFDVAMLEIFGTTDSYFDLATKSELLSLRPGIQVASAGFPTEGLDDLNIDKPEASYAAGYIKKMTDFDNKDAGCEYNRSIVHSIPTVGGSSGSPIFNAKGKVVAVLWGASHVGVNDQGERMSSAALQNFAVRIDQIDDVGVLVPWDEWTNGPTH